MGKKNRKNRNDASILTNAQHITPKEVREFQERIDAIKIATTQLKLIQEGSLVYAVKLKKKYGLTNDDFKIDPKDGRIIRAEDDEA